jgi:hypothetical protein
MTLGNMRANGVRTLDAWCLDALYDEDGLRLAATTPFPTPAEAFAQARKIVDNKVEGPRK